MRSFTDPQGRDWPFEINIGAVKKVKGLTGVDLYALVSPDGLDGLAEFLADPIRLIDVLYVLCRDVAEQRGVSDEDFGRLFRGDLIIRAAEKFAEEYADFFPNPAVRAGLARMNEAERRGRERLTRMAVEKIEGLDIDAMVEEMARKIEQADPTSILDPSSGPSGDSPERSGSTPPRLLSAS